MKSALLAVAFAGAVAASGTDARFRAYRLNRDGARGELFFIPPQNLRSTAGMTVTLTPGWHITRIGGAANALAFVGERGAGPNVPLTWTGIEQDKRCFVDPKLAGSACSNVASIAIACDSTQPGAQCNANPVVTIGFSGVARKLRATLKSGTKGGPVPIPKLGRVDLRGLEVSEDGKRVQLQLRVRGEEIPAGVSANWFKLPAALVGRVTSVKSYNTFLRLQLDLDTPLDEQVATLGMQALPMVVNIPGYTAYTVLLAPRTRALPAAGAMSVFNAPLPAPRPSKDATFAMYQIATTSRQVILFITTGLLTQEQAAAVTFSSSVPSLAVMERMYQDDPAMGGLELIMDYANSVCGAPAQTGPLAGGWREDDTACRVGDANCDIIVPFFELTVNIPGRNPLLVVVSGDATFGILIDPPSPGPDGPPTDPGRRRLLASRTA